MLLGTHVLEKMTVQCNDYGKHCYVTEKISRTYRQSSVHAITDWLDFCITL